MRSSHSGVSLLLALAPLTVLAACGRDESAVKSGARSLHALAGGGAAPATAEKRESTYKALAELDGDQPARLVLAAQAQLGLAAAPALEFTTLLGQAADQNTIIRGLVGQWVELKARSAQLQSVNPSAQLETIARGKAEKTRELARLTAAREELAGRIAALTAQAQEKIAAGVALQEKHAAVIRDTASKSAHESLEAVTQANAQKRRGDALVLEGRGIEAQAQTLGLELKSAELEILQAQNQIKEFDRAASDLTSLTASNKQMAAKLGEQAGQVAEQIATRLGELESLRGSKLDQALSGWLKACQTALSTAQKAATSGGSQNASGKLILASAQQALADAQLAQARELSAHADLLSALATALPLLPHAQDHERKTLEIRGQARRITEQAGESLEQAIAAYQSVPVRAPEARERLEKLGQDLERLAAKVAPAKTGIPAEPEAPAEPETPEAPAEPTAG